MPKLTPCLRWLKTLGLFALVLLHACTSIDTIQKPSAPRAKSEGVAPPKNNADGPPLEDLDVSLIPNAIPKPEPISRYGNPSIYEVFGKRYRTMAKSTGYEAKGIASWYGRKFHGQRTSSGEPYDMFGMTAAHRSLPLPTYAKVKNLNNGKEIIVKINDRGPFVDDRLIDLSYAAAKKLGIHEKGTGNVHITAIDPIAWHKEQNSKNSKLAKVNKLPKPSTQKAAVASKKPQTVAAKAPAKSATKSQPKKSQVATNKTPAKISTATTKAKPT